MPTILEAAGIPAPKVVDGLEQKPIEGVSMIYSFEDAQAESRRKTQYFEMLTNLAIYDDGWIASSRSGLRSATTAWPSNMEIELNPVTVLADGCWILDAVAHRRSDEAEGQHTWM